SSSCAVAAQDHRSVFFDPRISVILESEKNQAFIGDKKCMLGAFRLRSECYRGIVGEILRFDPNDSGSFSPSQGHNARDLRLVAAGVGFVARDEKRFTLTAASRDDSRQLIELGTFVLLGNEPFQLIAPNTVPHQWLRFAGPLKWQLRFMLVPLLSVEAVTGARFLANDKFEHPRLARRHGLLIVDRPVALHQRLRGFKGIWLFRLDSAETVQNIVVSMR